MTDTEAAPLNDLTNSIHLHIDISLFVTVVTQARRTTDVTVGGPR